MDTIPEQAVSAQERIMIIAPHPDDEVLAAGGMIARASKLHNRIRVIVATNGDASYSTALSYGSHLVTKKNFGRQAIMRQNESLNALASLGVDPTQVHFWGFPDRGLGELWKVSRDKESLYHSPTTGHDHSVQAVNSPVLPYTSDSLNALFDADLLDFSPTMIIMPHPCDDHSDHSSLANFTLVAATRYIEAHRQAPVLFAYWMWRKGRLWFTGSRSHSPGHLLIKKDCSLAAENHFILTREILDRKVRALQYYPSQRLAAGRIFRESSQKLYEAFTPIELAVQ